MRKRVYGRQDWQRSGLGLGVETSLAGPEHALMSIPPTVHDRVALGVRADYGRRGYQC